MPFWGSSDPTRVWSPVIKNYLPLPINKSRNPVQLKNGSIGVYYYNPKTGNALPGLYRRNTRKAVRNNEIMRAPTAYTLMPRTRKSRRPNRKTRRRRN